MVARDAEYFAIREFILTTHSLRRDVMRLSKAVSVKGIGTTPPVMWRLCLPWMLADAFATPDGPCVGLVFDRI